MDDSRTINYYSQFDEWGRLDREPLEFHINWHYIRRFLPLSGLILDNGAGPGKYAMELAKCGYRVTLADLTPRLVQVASAKAEELGLANCFQGFYVADARSLSLFSSECLRCLLNDGTAVPPATARRKKTSRERAAPRNQERRLCIRFIYDTDQTCAYGACPSPQLEANR